MESYDILVQHNIKPSLQRIAIMDYLRDHRVHPSAEDVYAALSPNMPTLSKTTVYNTLRLLAENGAILMLTIDDKNVNFDYDTSQHAHFLCRKCGKIYDYKSPLGQMLNDSVTEEGFRIEEAHVYYHGVCRDCLKTNLH
jgi:Fur family ferric uptake transcriptional regulator/Fur family peroxide stress response transcriptional regulator